jgi:hypothetical protein
MKKQTKNQPESDSEESDFEDDVPEKKVKLNRKKKTDKRNQKSTKRPTKSPKKPTKSDKPATNANSKKLFFVPGQKYVSPSDGDGTRVFYESLLNQNPKSLMAKKWCLEYGLLSKDKASEVMGDLKKSSKIKK